MRVRHGHLVTTLAALLLAASIGWPGTAVARDSGVVSRELSLARQAVILGNADDAIVIYERILKSYPEEERALWGLVEVYASTGQDLEKIVPLLTNWLEDHPHDLRAELELGAAFARVGDTENAHDVWMRALRDGEPDPAKYSEVGSLELRHGMLEEAVATYLEARRVLGEPELFAEDLVRAYTDLALYDEALEECLVTVREHSGIVQWAVNRVELLMDEGASKRAIEKKLDEAANDGSEPPSVYSFVGSSYMVLDRPGKALDAFLEADSGSTDEGRQLFDHAVMLRDAGYDEEAGEALRGIGKRYPDTVTAAKAGVELGLALARDGRTEDALEALRKTGDRFTQFSEGGEALLATARLELRQLHDPETAMATIDGLLSGGRSRSKRLIEESKLLRVEIGMAMGRFNEAHDDAEELLSGRVNPDIEERALYARAFSSFLAHERRRALDEFREMIQADPSGRFVNDALRVMLVIAEAEEELGAGPAELLADAHSAFLRGDLSAGYAKLAEMTDAYPGTAVATEGLLLLGAFETQEGAYERAIDTYSRVLEESNSLTARAEALMRSGDIMRDKLHRPEEALKQYSLILETLPLNALSGEARRKIDAVRRARGTEG